MGHAEVYEKPPEAQSIRVTPSPNHQMLEPLRFRAPGEKRTSGYCMCILKRVELGVIFKTRFVRVSLTLQLCRMQLCEMRRPNRDE